jgi:hypothetical protein
MKKDITMYSENELSLMVFNNESLYSDRNRSDFLEIIKDLFIYTDEQLQVLKDDLTDDRLENEEA